MTWLFDKIVVMRVHLLLAFLAGVAVMLPTITVLSGICKLGAQ